MLTRQGDRRLVSAWAKRMCKAKTRPLDNNSKHMHSNWLILPKEMLVIFRSFSVSLRVVHIYTLTVDILDY